MQKTRPRSAARVLAEFPGVVTLVGVLLVGAASSAALAQVDVPFTGMDESVNESLAEQAGRPSRDPVIDTESWGELWNLLLLTAGATCGFIVGRYWDHIWGRKAGPKSKQNSDVT
jgi:hypothetical protein